MTTVRGARWGWAGCRKMACSLRISLKVSGMRPRPLLGNAGLVSRSGGPGIRRLSGPHHRGRWTYISVRPTRYPMSIRSDVRAPVSDA